MGEIFVQQKFSVVQYIAAGAHTDDIAVQSFTLYMYVYSLLTIHVCTQVRCVIHSPTSKLEEHQLLSTVSLIIY